MWSECCRSVDVRCHDDNAVVHNSSVEYAQIVTSSVSEPLSKLMDDQLTVEYSTLASRVSDDDIVPGEQEDRASRHQQQQQQQQQQLTHDDTHVYANYTA